MLFAMLTSLALASEPCPESIRVYNLTTLEVDGERVKIGSNRRQSDAVDMLARCEPGSVDSFLRWRAARRGTTVTGIVGALVFWPALGGTAYFGIKAGEERARFESKVR